MLKTCHFSQKQVLWDLWAEYGHTDYFPSTYQEGTCSPKSGSIQNQKRGLNASDDFAAAEDTNSAPQQKYVCFHLPSGEQKPQATILILFGSSPFSALW